jgi:hypothetical protein
MNIKLLIFSMCVFVGCSVEQGAIGPPGSLNLSSLVNFTPPEESPSTRLFLSQTAPQVPSNPPFNTPANNSAGKWFGLSCVTTPSNNGSDQTCENVSNNVNAACVMLDLMSYQSYNGPPGQQEHTDLGVMIANCSADYYACVIFACACGPDLQPRFACGS